MTQTFKTANPYKVGFLYTVDATMKRYTAHEVVESKMKSWDEGYRQALQDFRERLGAVHTVEAQ